MRKSIRILTLLEILSWILLPIIAAYLKWFPTFINSYVSNLFISLVIIIMVLCLISILIAAKSYNDTYRILPQILIFVSIVISITQLRLEYAPLSDPYCHFISTYNIIQGGSLSVVLGWWYHGIDQQLHWPAMHLLSVILSYITNLNIIKIFMIQLPIIGAIFFLAVFLYSKRVTNDVRVGLLSGLVTCTSSTIIFYQSEYHPQGFALVYFAFIIYLFVGSSSEKNTSRSILIQIFILAFILSHHFSSLFVGLLALGFLVVLTTAANISYLKRNFAASFKNLNREFFLWGIIVVAALSYHFLVYTNFSETMLSNFQYIEPHFALVTAGIDIPKYVTYTNSSKWIVFMLAMVSLFYILKTKNNYEFKSSILLTIILGVGFVGGFLGKFPTDRVISFYTPIAALFASLTLFRFRDLWLKYISYTIKILILIFVISLPILGGIFGSLPPAYFFKESVANPYYWYSNDLTSTNMFKITGEWIRKMTPPQSKYWVDFDNFVIPFFYAQRPQENCIYRKDYPTGKSTQYSIINPSIPVYYNNTFFNKNIHIGNNNNIYNNGILVILGGAKFL
jgi:hypothetical protein